MAGNIKGITVEIGGNTTKLGKAIQDSEKKSHSLQSELKEVERALKFNPDNIELVSQKQEILKNIIEETSDKLKTLKDAQEQVKKQFDAGEIGVEDYRKFQREIVETESKLATFESKLKDAESGSDKLGDSIEKTGDESKNAGDGFTVMKGALADMISNVVMNAISMIGQLIGQLFNLTEVTEEYRLMQGKLAGSAETFGYNMDFVTGKYKQFYTYLGDDQMSTNAITNLLGIGASTETVSALADGAIGVWSAYGDSIPIESLTESVNETIKVGKVTGVMADTINWASVSNKTLAESLNGNKKAQDAFNQAIADGETAEDAYNIALSKVTDTEERSQIVAKFLNLTYGDSKEKFDEMSGSILEANEAELEFRETQAKLGEAMAPINTAMTKLKTQALEAITPLIIAIAEKVMNLYNYLKDHPTLLKIITGLIIALATGFTVLAGALAIQGLINGVTKAIAFLNTTLLANPIVWIVGLIAGLVAGFIYLWKNCDAFREFWINLWTKIKTFFVKAWTTIKTFVTETIPQMIKNIINWFKQLPGKIWTWLVAVVTKVVTWRINMIKKAIEIGKGFINAIVNFFKTLPGKIWNFLVEVITKVITWGANMIKKAVEIGKKFVTSIVNAIKNLPSKIWTWLKNTASKVVSFGSDLASKGRQAGKKLLNTVVTEIKQLPGKIKSIAGNVVTGLWEGIGNKVSWLKGKIKSFVGDVKDWLKQFFKIKSPSRLMRDEIGRYIAEGIGVGIDDYSYKPIDALKRLGNKLVNPDINLNGATLNRRLNSTFGGGSGVTVNSDEALLSKLDGIYNRLNGLQIVLDSGTLVGETIDKIDSALAVNQTLRSRGV